MNWDVVDRTFGNNIKEKKKRRKKDREITCEQQYDVFFFSGHDDNTSSIHFFCSVLTRWMRVVFTEYDAEYDKNHVESITLPLQCN